jgi:hypothetical protein
MPNPKEAKIVKGKDGKLRLENFYTPLSEAKKEIWRRWNDKALRKKVEGFLGRPLPKVLQKEPRAVLARHIVTPDTEYRYFLDLVKMIKLKPLGWEYLKDKFYTVNPTKLSLGKIYFFDKEYDSKETICSKKILSFKDKLEGKKICDLKTLWLENLVDFHHRLPNLVKIREIEKFDASHWYKQNGKNAKQNYKYFLGLFVRNGILFENFFPRDEQKFTKDIVLPAFQEIQKYFGLKPLIFPLIARKSETDLFWYCHHKSLIKQIDILMENKQKKDA